MKITTDATGKRIVFLLWVLVAVFYFYLSWDYIRATNNDKQFADYLHYVVQLAGVQQRPSRDIRSLLLVRAEQLSLPLKANQITVSGSGDSLTVNVSYDVDIEIPLVQREIYSKRFEHKERYRNPNIN
jgi:hypothetical protein